MDGRLDVGGAVGEVPAARSGPGRLATVVVIAVAAAAILAVSVLSGGGTDVNAGGGMTPVQLDGTATGSAPTVGRPLPSLLAPGVDGTTVSLAALQGHPVWLTFGASWCQPCRAENPDVVAAYERHKGSGLVVVQVYMAEDAATVKDYTERVGIPYLAVPDPSEKLANDFRILGIPTHYFIDADGILREMKIGSLTPEAMDAALAGIGG